MKNTRSSGMEMLKGLFRIDPLKEAEVFTAEQCHGAEPVERRALRLL